MASMAPEVVVAGTVVAAPLGGDAVVAGAVARSSAARATRRSSRCPWALNTSEREKGDKMEF